jgi:mRNA-degrading endonuclease RelE of RelBE toxin-antitoxin system
MSNFMVIITPQAKIALRKVKVNEKVLFTNALGELAAGPTEKRTEITFLSKRGKHDAYRYRTTVGILLYLVENKKKEVVVIDVQPFRR